MVLKRFFAVAAAVLCAALIFANGEKDAKRKSSSNVKIQYLYMLGTIKASIENDPLSPFSVYAENELKNGRRDLSRLYSELALKPEEKNAPVASAPASDGADLVCGKSLKRTARSYDGSAWLYAENYFVACDVGGVSLVVRSPAGMISGAPKDVSLCVGRSDKVIRCVGSKGIYDEVVVSVGAAGRSIALCAVDRKLSSPLLYDFSYTRGAQK